VRVEDDALWLRALIWPEHEERAELLHSAIALVRQQPLKMLAGDGVELLPDVTRTVPADAVLCIVRIFTPIARETRSVLMALIADYAAKRDVMMITARPHRGDDSELCLTSFVDGRRHEQGLAYMQNHGDWIEWLNRE
jgi:hypothetical protein